MCRTPEEMRAKLSVHFTGEEGIDAGGVSREWYQVCQTTNHHPCFLSTKIWTSPIMTFPACEDHVM